MGAGVDELLDMSRGRAPGIELDHPAVRALEDFGTRQDQWVERTGSKG